MTKSRTKRFPVLDAQALRDAQARWGNAGVVRHTRRFHSTLCEVGIADPATDGPPWLRPMIVLGSSWSWKRAFAEADSRAHEQQARTAEAVQATFVVPAKLELV